MKTVGIIGGMGPGATADFYARLVRVTPATRDQEHLRVIIDSHPQIPCRVAALAGEGPSPVPAMVESARLLENAGADFLVMPCNTAHCFLPEVQRQVTLPFINMIDEVVTWVRQQHPAANKVGLLATNATLQAGLYQARLAGAGLTAVLPSEPEQGRLLAAIAAVKAGEDLTDHRRAVRNLVTTLSSQGAAAVIAGCSEVPILLADYDDTPVADGNQILAAATVRFAMHTQSINRTFW